jgi:alkylhydroperoxidase/carboxymuconolactone decarboxylase family protein YurZ
MPDDPDAAESAAILAEMELKRGALEPALSHLVAATCQAARMHRQGTVLHLAEACAAGTTPARVCEAFSYLLPPCGGNTLIEAVEHWEAGAREELLPPPC